MSNLLEIKNLEKKYLNKTALSNVNLTLEGGKIFGLLGPNGSGKTTLMKIIAGLHKQTKGDVLINGEPISYKTKAFVSYMPTENYLIDSFTIKRTLLYYKDMFADFDMTKATEYLSKNNIDLKSKVSDLSSGLAAKLKLTLALSRNASIYLLDEPLNGIDIVARENIIKTIVDSYSEDKMFIISSHIVDEIEKIFDSVIFIKNQEVALFANCDDLRTERQMSIENVYKEVFKEC